MKFAQYYKKLPNSFKFRQIWSYCWQALETVETDEKVHRNMSRPGVLNSVLSFISLEFGSNFLHYIFHKIWADPGLSFSILPIQTLHNSVTNNIIK